MAADDLSAPLGQDKRRSAARAADRAFRRCSPGVLGLFVLVFVGWALFVDDPLGGEPMAVVATESAGRNRQARRRPATASSIPATTGRSRQGAVRDSGHAAPPSPPPPGSKTITIIDGTSGKRQEVIIPGKSSGNAPKAPVDQRLLETIAPRRDPEDRAGRRAAGRRSMPHRSSCRRARPTRRASRS